MRGGAKFLPTSSPFTLFLRLRHAYDIPKCDSPRDFREKKKKLLDWHFWETTEANICFAVPAWPLNLDTSPNPGLPSAVSTCHGAMQLVQVRPCRNIIIIRIILTLNEKNTYKVTKDIIIAKLSLYHGSSTKSANSFICK